MKYILHYSLFSVLTLSLLSSDPFNRTNRQRLYPHNTRLRKVKLPKPTALPEYLKPVKEPVFKTEVVRITDPDAFKSSRKVLRHNYSKHQAFNSDETMIMVANMYLLDGKTFKLIGTYSAPSSECFWSNSRPHVMYAFDPKKFRLVSIDVKKKRQRVLYTFKNYEQMFMGRWEGNISTDDEYVAFMGRKKSDLYIITFNIRYRRILKVKKFPGLWRNKDNPDIDWVSFSQSGAFVLINWVNSGSGRNCGVELFDRNMKFIRQLAVTGEHGDIGYDTRGNEVYVQFTCTSRNKYNAEIIAVRLKDGKTTRVIDSSLGGFGGHISCRNTRRPGWAYVSAAAPFYEVFAVKLDGSQTVERFAHTHSSAQGYASEPQAVPNHYGDKVIFASCWYDNSGKVFSYITYMPSLRKRR